MFRTGFGGFFEREHIMTLLDVVKVFITAMLPVLEVRGAIPLAIAKDFPPVFTFILCTIGNMVPIPALILLSRKILQWLKHFPRVGRLAHKLEARAQKHSKLVHQFSFWGLMILVAIPLPGTGAWTGALVASFLNMRLRNSLPAIFLGVCIAAAIVMCVSYGVVAAI